MESRIIIYNLAHSGALFRLRAILLSIINRVQDPDVLQAIAKLKNDKVMMLGRPVSAYAIAALDILGQEKYQGNDPDIIELVEALPELQFGEEDLALKNP